MKRPFAVAILLFSFHVHATDWKESRDIGELFRGTHVSGTFVLYDVVGNQFVGHDQSCAEKRFVPASTFKIANKLIGFSVGAVSSVDEVPPTADNLSPSKPGKRTWG